MNGITQVNKIDFSFEKWDQMREDMRFSSKAMACFLIVVLVAVWEIIKLLIGFHFNFQASSLRHATVSATILSPNWIVSTKNSYEIRTQTNTNANRCRCPKEKPQIPDCLSQFNNSNLCVPPLSDHSPCMWMALICVFCVPNCLLFDFYFLISSQ